MSISVGSFCPVTCPKAAHSRGPCQLGTTETLENCWDSSKNSYFILKYAFKNLPDTESSLTNGSTEILGM